MMEWPGGEAIIVAAAAAAEAMVMGDGDVVEEGYVHVVGGFPAKYCLNNRRHKTVRFSPQDKEDDRSMMMATIRSMRR
jgi:hypothetical protein